MNWLCICCRNMISSCELIMYLPQKHDKFMWTWNVSMRTFLTVLYVLVHVNWLCICCKSMISSCEHEMWVSELLRYRFIWADFETMWTWNVSERTWNVSERTFMAVLYYFTFERFWPCHIILLYVKAIFSQSMYDFVTLNNLTWAVLNNFTFGMTIVWHFVGAVFGLFIEKQ